MNHYADIIKKSGEATDHISPQTHQSYDNMINKVIRAK